MENYQIEQKINVYLDAGGIPPEVYIKQYDHNLRVIAAQVWDGAQPYALPAGYVARVGVRKSDGKRVLNDCETSADGPTLTVYAVITQQMTAVAGKQRAEIQISGPEGQLRSGSFVLDVVPAEVGEDVIESTDEYKSIDALLAEVRQLKAAADKDAQAAVQSAAAAKASETAAANSQSAAAGSATAAATSETAAQASAAAAAASETAAAGSANAAKASETAAAQSAADAAAAAERADGVHEINGKTGRVVTLTPADIGAATAAQGQIAEGLIDGSQTAARAESAAAAAKLSTPRKIGSADFDGSGDITLAQMGAATAAQGAKADAAMPKSGGSFTGTVHAPAFVSSGSARVDSKLFFGTGSENYGICAEASTGYVRAWGLSGLKVTDNTGNLKPVSASNISGSSSRRYKHRIRDMDEDTAKRLLQLRPVGFEYKKELNDPGPKYGLVAEELTEIDPTCVYKGGNGQVEGINYTMLVPQLIKLCQIQQDQIDALERRLSALETKEG